jgi:OOP family OmpA-OmpF porin
LIALVIRGHAPLSLLRKQQRALEAFHLQYANALVEFNGDAAPLEDACFLLEECLETVVATPQVRHGRWHWVRWTVPVAVASGALLTLAIRSRARFERAVALLRDEPGIVVMDANRGWRWGNWSVTGLRDPDARTPQTVLAAAGLLPRSLSGRWESFVSLDSGIVVARARAAWRLPASSQLHIENGALHVSGPVPLLAIGFMQRASLPAGVSQLMMDSLSIILPEHLDSLRASIMAGRVLFTHGESTIDALTGASIRQTAQRFVALQDSLMANSADVSLTLLGRTDPTGTERRNASLAQWRIDRVRAILAGEGVRAEHLREMALATARPLDAPDSAQRARINRSVSYEIALSARLRRSN